MFIIGFRDVHDFEAYRPPAPTMEAATLGQVVFDEAAVGERYYFSSRAPWPCALPFPRKLLGIWGISVVDPAGLEPTTKRL